MGVYNDEEYVSMAIESVLQQELTDFEFIIIDDGSTDRTPDIIEGFDDGRIRVLENEENIGLTASLNRGLEEARGEYIARQDADDKSIIGRFRKQVNFLDSNPEIAMVGSAAKLIDESGEHLDTRRVLCQPTFENIYHTNRFIHGSVMMRRSVLEEVGGYDEFYRYGQDYDLWLRLAQRWKLANLSEPLYCLRLHDESVYFDERGKSTLYSMYAKQKVREGVPDDQAELVEEEGISACYDCLSDNQRKEFHISQAQRALRYGHYDSATQQARTVMDIDKAEIRAYLLYALALGGYRPTQAARYGIRRLKNTRILVENFRRGA